MPALWPTFIPNLASDIASQSFTKPGGAIVSYDLPKVGVDQVPIFPPSADLIKSIKPGNPLNAALTTDPTAMINAINLAPLSGRYDFGVAVAERYLEAVKGLAMTPFGATHTNNPAAELILKQGYGLIFEQLLKEGDIPLQDQKDKDGNIIKMGKESHPDYADFCPDPIEIPDPIEEEKKQAKKFSKFIEDYKNDPMIDLHKFKHFEFHCLDGTETENDLIKLFTNRLLQQYETLTNDNARWNYILWAISLGKERYKDLSTYEMTPGGSYFRNRFPYVNVSTEARTDISNAGYSYQTLTDGISALFLSVIEQSYPYYSAESELVFDLEKRVRNGLVNPIVRPWPYDPNEKEDCPLSMYKIQVSYNREHNPPENPSKRPKILTDHVVALFSYSSVPVRDFWSAFNLTTGASQASRRVYWWQKDNNYVKLNYENTEYKINWIKIPNAINNVRTPEDIIAIDPKQGGSQFKFQRQQVIDAKTAAEECDALEPDADIDYVWPGGDPWIKMGAVTIAYWYACIVKPFAPSPSALPALIPPPLTGLYIPIYYGSAKRLGNNLRKAWNTGKTFSKIPAPQPPALAVSTAVAAAYALHLLEFKLLYLGGIPTPVGPVPMVGFVPVVF
tara:strand:+ start:9863 stop:11719 length:1857 start_codon:yes stop_codon:yes gene_type:complete